jgi:hypothetical protein
MLQTTKPVAVLRSLPAVTADALFEVGTAVISDVLSRCEQLMQTNISCVSKFCYRVVYCRMWYFLVRTHATRFPCEVMFQKMNTCSAREYTVFASVYVAFAQLA